MIQKLFLRNIQDQEKMVNYYGKALHRWTIGCAGEVCYAQRRHHTVLYHSTSLSKWKIKL